MKHIITVLALIAATSAQAYIYTGNTLLERIQSSDAADRRVAMGYISGVADGLDQITHCIPNGVTVGQILDLTRAELLNSPAERHDDASMFVSRVLYRTWPCKKGGNL
jgi:hypothetical protein